MHVQSCCFANLTELRFDVLVAVAVVLAAATATALKALNMYIHLWYALFLQLPSFFLRVPFVRRW